MSELDMDVVSELKLALRARLGEDRFDLWLTRGVELAYAEGTLTISASEKFVADRLRSQFQHDFAAICRDLLGVPTSIQFLVSASPETPRKTGEPLTTPATAQAKPTLPSDPVVPDLLEKQSSLSHARRPQGTFESFVAGEGNRVAFSASQHTANRLGAVSPLFLFGPTGCGKTHLVQGILSAVRRSGRVRRSVLLTAEQFTTQFLEALQGSGLPSFRRKYRDVELLLIDDVQFFAGKRATLVEVLHTLDTLHREGRQIVLTADRPPVDLAVLGPELVARASAGLVCGLEPADDETRMAILKQACARLGLALPRGVLEMMAEQLPGDARQLLGAVHRLQATSEALERPINLDLAQRALADIIRATRRVVRLPDIERAVCEVFGLEPNSLKSNQKVRAVSQPRMLAMWLARKFTRAPLTEIGQHFGRSHSTVISAQKQVNDWMTSGAALRLLQGECSIDDAIRRVEAQLRTG